MHPLASLHGAIVVGLVLLVDYSKMERQAALRSVSTLTGAAAFGIVFVAQFLLLKADPRDELPIAEYVNILAWERHPGDYLPSRFPVETVGAFVIAALSAGVVLFCMRREIPRLRLVTATLAVYAGICLSGWLFVEVYPLRFFVQLIPFRTANIGAPFMLSLFAWFAGKELRERRVTSFLLMVLLFLLASPYAARAAGAYGSLLRLGAPTALLALLVVRLVARRPLGEPLDAALLRWLTGPRLAFLLAAALVGLGAIGARARRDGFVVPRVENQHPVYAWLREHTDPTTTVFVDQYSRDARYSAANNPQKLRLVGRRAVVASLDFPFLDRDMRAWLARWKLALHGREQDRVSNADLGALREVQRQFPFELVIRRAPLPPHPGIRLEAEFHGLRGVENVFVYRLLGT
jgi:hypothetical protein